MSTSTPRVTSPSLKPRMLFFMQPGPFAKALARRRGLVVLLDLPAVVGLALEDVVAERVHVGGGRGVVRGGDHVHGRARRASCRRAHQELDLERRRVVGEHLLVERVRHRHRQALLDQRRGLLALGRRDQVEGADLVAGAPAAPVRDVLHHLHDLGPGGIGRRPPARLRRSSARRAPTDASQRRESPRQSPPRTRRVACRILRNRAENNTGGARDPGPGARYWADSVTPSRPSPS